MKYLLRLAVSILVMFVFILIPIIGSQWKVNRKNVPQLTFDEMVRKFPVSLNGETGDIFHNSDNTQAFRNFGKTGSISIKKFPTEQSALNSVLVNPSLLSQGRVKKIKNPSSEGFYYTTDTKRIGFYWINGPYLFTIEASDRKALSGLAENYPILKLKLNLFRLAVEYFNHLGLWVLPLVIIVIFLVMGYCAFTAIAGLLALMGSRRGQKGLNISETEMSARLEEQERRGLFLLEEGNRYDYRINKRIAPLGDDSKVLKTRSGHLTLNPVNKTVYYGEHPVSISFVNGEPKIKRNFTILPVIPNSSKYNDDSGPSLASILAPTVTSSGWNWRTETEIPSTRAIIRMMQKRSQEK